MKISIIIPVYNDQKCIENCINSVLSQSYKNMEILVCDDGSTDKTYEILKYKYSSKISLYKNTTRKGVVYSRNLLLEKATGDLISFLDSDDTIIYNRNEIFVNEFQKDKKLILCGSNFNFFFNNILIRKSKLPILYKKINKNKIYNSFLGSSICYRVTSKTKNIRQRKFFNDKCYEDIDFILQLSKYGNIKNVNESLYNYHYNSLKLEKNLRNYNPYVYAIKDLIVHMFENKNYNEINFEIDNEVLFLEKKLINKYNKNIYKLNYEISLLLRLNLLTKAYRKFLKLLFYYPFNKLTLKSFIKVIVINKFTINYFFKL